MLRSAFRHRLQILTLLVLFSWVVGGLAQSAQAYPDTRTMTCAAAHSLVLKQGQVRLTFSTSPDGGEVYDLFNDGNNRCQLDEEDQPEWAPTTDSPQCFVGYVCHPRHNNNH